MGGLNSLLARMVLSEKPRSTQIDENKYLISGNLSIRDWSDTFGVIEPMGVDTVGGFVITLLEHIPKKAILWNMRILFLQSRGVRKRRITSRYYKK